MGQTTLRDAVAVVTGGAGGIGSAISNRLSAAGANVTIVDRELSEGKSGIPGLKLDIGDSEAVEASFATIQERQGVPTVVVNAAGIHARAQFVDTSIEMWDEIMRVNGLGPLL
jgi:NAD(P)-dependent dehydrogenase (short-subunit alcohol dehydrogenase family)